MKAKHSGFSVQRSAFSGPCSIRARSPRTTNNQSRTTNHAAFTLIEVTLAIAVVAIGLVGILALFPLGLRATRGAADDTQMATIAQELISKFQQAALQTNGVYAGVDVLTNSPPDVAGSITNDLVVYNFDCAIADSGFPQMSIGTPATNLLSRVTILLWRAGSKTNTYVTEVARYVQP